MVRLHLAVIVSALFASALLVAAPEPESKPSVPARGEGRVRLDADDLLKPENKAKLDALKLAFKTLKESNDPKKNMIFWANIHGAPLGEMTTGPCEHNNEVIWAWHRAYLYQFETALRESHPPETNEVTLPYWNWTAPPSGKRYPKIFEEEGSSLNYANRVTTEFPYAPVALQDKDLLNMGQGDWDLFGGGPKNAPHKGMLESKVHDPVHGFIGKDNRNTDKSARDPIFWAHHANLDRIWLEWQNNFSQQPVGLNEPIRGLTGTQKDWLDVSAKYKYGPKANAGPGPRPLLFTSRLKLVKRQPGGSFDVTVPKLGAGDRLILRLKDVRPPAGKEGYFTGEVFLHPKGTNIADGGGEPRKKYYLTYFGYWDSTHQQGKGQHRQQVDIVLDVTARGRDILKQTGDGPLTLTIEFIGNIQDGRAAMLPYGNEQGVHIGGVDLVSRAPRAPKKGKDAPKR